VWATEQAEVDGFGGDKMIVGRRVTIFMLRSQDSQGAKKTAQNFFKNFSHIDDLKHLVNAPTQNTYFGMATNNQDNIIISTSIGPISFGVISRIDSDDGMTEGEIAAYFLNKQIKKLQDAGVFIRQ
jgi:hypothetical protein